MHNAHYSTIIYFFNIDAFKIGFYDTVYVRHKDVSTTQIYANMTNDSKRESVHRITLKPRIAPQLKVVGQS